MDFIIIGVEDSKYKELYQKIVEFFEENKEMRAHFCVDSPVSYPVVREYDEEQIVIWREIIPLLDRGYCQIRVTRWPGSGMTMFLWRVRHTYPDYEYFRNGNHVYIWKKEA